MTRAFFFLRLVTLRHECNPQTVLWATGSFGLMEDSHVERRASIWISTLGARPWRTIPQPILNVRLRSGSELLPLTPLLEDVHLKMMQCYHRPKDRAAVARQYRQLEQVLRDYLGIEPNEAAKVIYRELGAA